MTDKPVTAMRRPRDSARSFDAYSLNIQRIEESTARVRQRVKDEPGGRIKSMRDLIFMNYLHIAKVMYCRGDEFETIQQPVSDGIDYVLNFDEKSNLRAVYVCWLEYAALAVLLKMPERVFRSMKAIIDREGGRDQVLDHLLSAGIEYKKGEASQSGLTIQNNLNLAIDCSQGGGSDCRHHLLNYLNDEWHNGGTILASMTHRANPELPYDGVYCFPVAAMAYINKLDDTELRKSEYYPSDIADYAHR